MWKFFLYFGLASHLSRRLNICLSSLGLAVILFRDHHCMNIPLLLLSISEPPPKTSGFPLELT